MMIALAGCQSGPDATDIANTAEAEYRIVEKSGGTSAELCAYGQTVADAFLKAQNADKYEEWRTETVIQCAEAEIKAMPK